MLRKRLAVQIIAFLAVVLVLAPQAMAAAIPFKVYINGKLNPAASFVTQENSLTVEVLEPDGTDHKVKVGSTVAEKVSDGEYLVENYRLKAGTNKVTVSADTYKNAYNITYVDEALPGASYYLPSIANGSTITAINKTITLKFPKNNYIVNQDDPDDPEIVDEQGLIIEIAGYDDGDSPTCYHQAVSPVYKITPTSNDLDSDSERLDAALLYPGELTLKYDANVSAAAADNLTVVYIPYKESDYDSYDNDYNYNNYWSDNWADRECIVLGGRVNASAHTITVPFSKTGFGSYAVFNVNREFTDLLDSNNNLIWARNYVLPMWAKGVMDQLGSGETFGDTPITREEFTVAIVKAMGIPVENGLRNPFEDVDDFHLNVDEYADYILTASKNGIINGSPEGGGTYFYPEQRLTREQAATIIARVAELKVSDSESTTIKAMAKAFNDFSTGNFSIWATPYIYASYKAGFMKGSPEVIDNKTVYSFNPQTDLSRFEAAKLIYVLMRKQNNL